MSVEANRDIRLTVIETLPDGSQLKRIIGELQVRLNASSTPAISAQAGGEHTLTSGTETLDLTAIANQAGANVDFSGLKVQLVVIETNAANTEVVVFDVGASNGYYLFGDANGQVALGAGEMHIGIHNESRPDVSGTAKTVDVSSSDADAKYTIVLLAG